MKAKTFEYLIRKIVREEIDYSLRREIKSLKEDLREERTSTIVESSNNIPVPESTRNTLREKIMGKKPIKKQNFVKDSTLNSLLNETAQGDTNTQPGMAPVGDPFSSAGSVPTEAMPSPVQKVVNRDYRDLMKAISNKKGKA